MPLHLSTILEAADRLRAGGVVAFPTETVYGLGADALNEDGVRRVFALKGRPSNNPLIVHVSDESMAKRVVGAWPDIASRLASAFWPGPLTLVLPRAACVPEVVTAGGPGVAVRCPDHPVAIALIEALGSPIVGPSANPSGRVSPTTAEHVRAAFNSIEVMVLDGGACRAGIESTVLSLLDPEPIVLRRGVVTPEQVSRVLGTAPRIAGGINSDSPPPGAPMPSPGMLRSHYAPEAPLELFEPSEWSRVSRGTGVVVALCMDPATSLEPPSRVIPMPADATLYAAALYAALRDADALRPDLIAVERPRGVGGVWDAVRDRLERAAAPR